MTDEEIGDHDDEDDARDDRRGLPGILEPNRVLMCIIQCQFCKTCKAEKMFPRTCIFVCDHRTSPFLAQEIPGDGFPDKVSLKRFERIVEECCWITFLGPHLWGGLFGVGFCGRSWDSLVEGGIVQQEICASKCPAATKEACKTNSKNRTHFYLSGHIRII